MHHLNLRVTEYPRKSKCQPSKTSIFSEKMMFHVKGAIVP